MPYPICTQTLVSSPNPQLLTRLAWEGRWGNRTRSIRFAQQALDLIREQPDADPLARSCALRTLGWQAKWRGDFEATAAHCLQAKQGVDRQAARHILVDVYSLLGVVHYSSGRRDFASRMVQRGFDLLNEQVPDEARVDLHTTHATILRYRGRSKEARHAMQAALDLAKGCERARVEHSIARGLNHDGHFEDAAERAEASLDLARQFGNRVILPYALEVLGTSYLAQGRYDEAIAVLDEGLVTAQEDNDRRAACQILNQSGIAHQRVGASDIAYELLVEGQAIARDMRYPIWIKSFSHSLAEVHEARGDYERATEAYKEVVTLQNAMRD